MDIVFKKAFDHYNYILKDAIQRYSYNDYSFESIFVYVNSVFKNIKGLGILAIIDVTKCICNEFSINVDRIYLVGSGPKTSLKEWVKIIY